MKEAKVKLPDLSSEYPLTEEQIESYRRNGHILLRGVCRKAEIAAFRPVIKAAAYEHFPKMPEMKDRPEEDFSRAFVQTFNLRNLDAGVAQFVLAHRFAGIVADLMGVDGVRIYYDKAMFKEPGGWITPWHQDGPHWPLAIDNVVTFWMPLVDLTPDMGTLKFASGTHKKRYFGPTGIHKATEIYYANYIKENHCPVFEEPLEAGDVSIHNHWTIHGAGANTSQRMREVMAMTYYEDGARIDDTVMRELNEPDFKFNPDSSLGNKMPGELADSEMNPLVFRR